MKHPLQVWVTRPAGQADNLLKQLKAYGANTLHVPLIIIQELEPDALGQQHLQKLSQNHYQGLIFISQNAVKYSLPWLEPYAKNIKQANIGAIGSQTARALQQTGLTVHWQPAHEFTSEALLALPGLQHIAGQNLLIIRGRGGREILKGQLRQRGAQVDYLEVYQRQCPQQTALATLKQQYLAHGLDMIMLTSSEGLENLLTLLQGETWALTVPLLTGSQRITKNAQRAGFSGTIITASDPSDKAMLTAFAQWQAGFNHD